MAAVVASLAPPEPAPALVEPAPAPIAAVEPEVDEESSGQPTPEPQPAPEPTLVAYAPETGDVSAQEAAARAQPAPPPPPAPAEPQPGEAPVVAATDAPARRVTAIGDSVMLAAAGDLAEAILNIEVDAEVGRVVSTGIDILRSRRDAGQLGDVVVVHIGNNSPFTASQFDEMMQVLTGVTRVVFVNLKVPRGWEGPNNSVLAEGVTHYANAVLLDWHSASVDNPQYFNDGLHLRPEGALVYAQLVAAAVGSP